VGSAEEYTERKGLLYAEFATGNQGKHDIDARSLAFHELYRTADDPRHTSNTSGRIRVLLLRVYPSNRILVRHQETVQ